MGDVNKKRIFSAQDVSTYVVCPEAWNLKQTEEGRLSRLSSSSLGRSLREEWVEKQDLSVKLRDYAKIAYLLLVGLAIVVFLIEGKRTSSSHSDDDPPIEAQDARTPD